MPMIDGDRRSNPRIAVNCPCKFHDARSGKYFAGSTRDLSTGGAMIEVPRLLALKPGDIIHIGVAAKRRQSLIRCDEMIRAAVTRAVQTVDDCTLVGLRFEESQAHPETLRLAA